MNPTRKFDCGVKITIQIPPMDRLVMRSSVANEHEVGQVMFDFATPTTEVVMASGKRQMERWNPQARVVALSGEVSPEAEIEFSDDLAVSGGRPPIPGGAETGPIDVGVTPDIQRNDIQPGRRPAASRPRDELGIEGIANDDFDHRRGLHDSGRSSQVPLIERERAIKILAAAGEVGAQAIGREQIADGFGLPSEAGVRRDV
jgi:hypothetical protein